MCSRKKLMLSDFDFAHPEMSRVRDYLRPGINNRNNEWLSIAGAMPCRHSEDEGTTPDGQVQHMGRGTVEVGIDEVIPDIPGLLG